MEGTFCLKLLLVSLFSLSQCAEKRIVYSTIENDYLKIFEVENESDIPNYHLSKAVFDNKINSTGWSYLELHTSDKYNDDIQAYSAGFLEGVLTHDLIWMHWQNTMADLCTGRKIACMKIKMFIDKNKNWVKSMIAAKSSVDPYWYQVKLYLRQLEGLADGYNKINKNPKQALSKDYLMAMNLDGDLEDLFAMEGFARDIGDGHCSALIKILPDGSDLYVSQVTWTGYETMLRIQKKYVLNYKTLPGSTEKIKGHTMSFSSYPGSLQSGDDFYILSSGLVSLETTIGNTNKDLWQYVNARGQVLEFIRTMVANRLADSGASWSSIFKKFNSGTYNNQWMVVDYKKFKAGSDSNSKPTIKPGLLWVLEQIPGTIEMQDMTELLQDQTYWPSYNLPYFPKIFNMSGTLDMVKKYGDWFDYYKHPRAQIFKRDHVKVNNMDDMLALMRYNDFKHDPLSHCDCQPPYSAENAISARNDLNMPNGTYPINVLGYRFRGATDAKITNAKLMQNYQFLAVSGPTYNQDRGLPPFKWSKAGFVKKIPHFGHPDDWQFKPVTFAWTWEEN